jgi:GrpB protein
MAKHSPRSSLRLRDQERDHLAFRDFLRRNATVAAEYVALKRRLAAAHDGLTMESQERYSLAKSDFVRSVLVRALTEGQGMRHATRPELAAGVPGARPDQLTEKPRSNAGRGRRFTHGHRHPDFTQELPRKLLPTRAKESQSR